MLSANEDRCICYFCVRLYQRVQVMSFIHLLPYLSCGYRTPLSSSTSERSVRIIRLVPELTSEVTTAPCIPRVPYFTNECWLISVFVWCWILAKSVTLFPPCFTSDNEIYSPSFRTIMSDCRLSQFCPVSGTGARRCNEWGQCRAVAVRATPAVLVCRSLRLEATCFGLRLVDCGLC
jgi:hypothetical protein